MVELFVFPRFSGRLVVPALFLLEPVLDPIRAADDAACTLGVGVRVCIDEDVVAVARDGEAPGPLGGAQLLEQRPRIRWRQMDAEVVYAGILPKSAMPVCSRCFVIPPRKNG